METANVLKKQSDNQRTTHLKAANWIATEPDNQAPSAAAGLSWYLHIILDT